MVNDAGTIFFEGEIDEDVVYVPANSMVALLVLHYCEQPSINISIVCKNSRTFHKNVTNGENNDPEKSLEESLKDLVIHNDKAYFPIAKSELNLAFSLVKRSDCPAMIQNCLLPAVMNAEKDWCVAGLCSSIRYVLKETVNQKPGHFSNSLLGFRNGCLQACAEVSVWTKFCEVEVLNTVSSFFNIINDSIDTIEFPSDILRFEEHLKHPPILHNALKQKQNHLKKTIKDKDMRQELSKKKLSELPELEHKYAEGLTLTLADVILFGCFHILIKYLEPTMNLSDVCPLVIKWHNTMTEDERIQSCLPFFHKILEVYKAEPTTRFKHNIPEVPKESLYKSDPDRYKPRWRAFTNQDDIDKVLFKVEEGDLNPEYGENASSSSMDISWEDMPLDVGPEGGQLPAARLIRKQQQLKNMAEAVLPMAKDNDIIVDFCAGGGHLGILLAYLLPKCTVFLVENKESSLERAKTRIKTLELNNVQFYQCNLDYFVGSFNIGVSLHACGVATDLTMQKCFDVGASFVSCPCCYGSVQPNHILEYPRSSEYKSLSIALEEYLTLGHAADQTHGEDNIKTPQGQLCMRLVDYDRLCLANKLGYNTTLLLMQPSTCTPKNHILVGAKC